MNERFIDRHHKIAEEMRAEETPEQIAAMISRLKAEKDEIEQRRKNRPENTIADLSAELSRLRAENERLKGVADDLLPFLAVWANQFSLDRGMDGLHPTHYDLMEKYGARMTDFKRAALTEGETK